MKIVTVNVPESYIDAIEKLIGDDGLYPSRSELVRCAVREFLLKELGMAKNIANYEVPKSEEIDFDSEHFVRIPIYNKNKEPSFKTYKILRRLENSEKSSESGDIIEDDYKYNDNDFNYESNGSNDNEYMKPSLEDLRKRYPYLPEYKYINEGEKGELLNI